MDSSLLIFVANPRNTKYLKMRREIDQIYQVVPRDKVAEEWAISRENLGLKMMVYDPFIVHFSGHGEPEGLLLESEEGEEDFLDAKSLSEILRIRKKNIRCVVLNCCFSADYMGRISEHIDCVIGMEGEVSDNDSIQFSRVFYAALFGGDSVYNSFKFAVASLPQDSMNLPKINISENNKLNLFLRKKNETSPIDKKIWADPYSKYERQLIALLQNIEKEHDDYPFVMSCKARLDENLLKARRYGDSKDNQVQRAEIVDQLNRICYRSLGKFLEDL